MKAVKICQSYWQKFTSLLSYCHVCTDHIIYFQTYVRIRNNRENRLGKFMYQSYFVSINQFIVYAVLISCSLLSHPVCLHNTFKTYLLYTLWTKYVISYDIVYVKDSLMTYNVFVNIKQIHSLLQRLGSLYSVHYAAITIFIFVF